MWPGVNSEPTLAYNQPPSPPAATPLRGTGSQEFEARFALWLCHQGMCVVVTRGMLQMLRSTQKQCHCIRCRRLHLHDVDISVFCSAAIPLVTKPESHLTLLTRPERSAWGTYDHLTDNLSLLPLAMTLVTGKTRWLTTECLWLLVAGVTGVSSRLSKPGIKQGQLACRRSMCRFPLTQP